MIKLDLAGQRFGKLTVLSFSHKECNKNYWFCLCDCGNTCTAPSALLRSGYIRSCGCPVEKQKVEEITVKVGQRVRFDPYIDIKGFGTEMNRGNLTTGVVTFVNHAHRWFLVEYGEHRLRISFKYCDLRDRVQLVK